MRSSTNLFRLLSSDGGMSCWSCCVSAGVIWFTSGTGTGTGSDGGPVGGVFVIVIGTARLQCRVS
jgi:hypothetical protein